MIQFPLHRTRAVSIVAALLALAACAPAFALDPKTLKPQGYVNDFANVLDPAVQAQLTQYCGQVEQATGAQMAIVTITSLDDQPVEDFTNTLYRQWGVGKKGKDEGVMLLLAIRDRKSRVEAGYGLEPILPDGFNGSVLREMRPSLAQGSYGQALLAGAAEIGDQIAKAKGVSLTRTIPRRSAPPEPVGGGRGLPWPMILVALVFLLMIFGRGGGGGGGLLTWMLLGNVLGGSRYRGGGGGGWGGGGFGGSDGGGGGFGGFGGGDSGGGGASGSW